MMMTADECKKYTELDIIELGPLIAYYWRACLRWPHMTFWAAFEQADFWRVYGHQDE